MPAFTSGLSVADLALMREAGATPLAQVMGSSVYHVGWQWPPGSWGVSQELEVVSQAWNEARRLALGRLRDEAVACGADAVGDVTITEQGHDWASEAIEFVALGTAVRIDGSGGAVLTDLSAPDYWKLHEAGYRPLGIVGGTTVYYVVASWATQRAQSGLFGSRVNQELTDFTQGVYDAREAALDRVTREAARLGADGVVGVRVDQRADRREVDSGGSSRIDLVVTFHVVGTAIAAPAGAPTELPVTTTLDRGGTT